MDPADIIDPTLVPGGLRARRDSRGLPPGLVVSGRYQIGRLLGAGGMGLIYEAEHLVLGTSMVLKVLRPELSENAWHVRRAANEARCLAAVNSEHVVRILDAGRLPSGLHFLVLERLRGLNLQQVIEASGPLPASTTLDYGLQICRGLSAVHARGIIHRDIKPANLFLEARTGLPPRVKIVDFGIAGSLEQHESDVSSDERHLGSPAYAAPEQREDWRAADARADIWSVGVVLLELLMGKTSARAWSGAPGSAACQRPLDSRPHMPEALADVIKRCLEPSRRCRYGSIEELAAALESLQERRSSGAPALPKLRLVAPPQRRAHAASNMTRAALRWN